MKFAHLGDCHLGSWRYPELQDLNMGCFSQAIDTCIKEKVDFVLIAGDLFDTAYPSIEILKLAFAEFRKLKQSKIPCYIIAGSHDYSVSGKTFLDVLEYAGFCKNVFNPEIKDDKILLIPTLSQGAAIYGYPGKKSGLEIPDLEKVEIQDSPGYFKIFMLHTSIKDAIGTLPIDSIDVEKLPKADYYALAHLHIDYCKKNIVYSGPIFPANFQELEELQGGSFYIVEIGDRFRCDKIELKPKKVIVIELEINNPLTATEKIISEFDKKNLEDKIVLLKLYGLINTGKISDIRFTEIEDFAKKHGALILLKSTTKLKKQETGELTVEITDMEKLEENIVETYTNNPEQKTKFNNQIESLIRALSLEKQEDEKNQIFEERLLEELKKILKFE